MRTALKLVGLIIIIGSIVRVITLSVDYFMNFNNIFFYSFMLLIGFCFILMGFHLESLDEQERANLDLVRRRVKMKQ
jgi:uncharacterized membrane protein